MTVQEIMTCGKDLLTPSDISEIIGSNPDTIGFMVKQDPTAFAPLQPIRTGNRVKFPRMRFLHWYFGETPEGCYPMGETRRQENG